MLKNATMDSGTMTDHLVKVGVLTDLSSKLTPSVPSQCLASA